MLKVPSLDETSYEKLFQRARSLIPTITGQWTDFNDHDPGITTLQLYAWLTDLLNYYMDATGEAHRLKYLKLLGLEPAPRAARCILGLEGAPGPLPRGTRAAAGETVFELEEAWPGEANRLVGLYSEEDGRMDDLTRVAGRDGGFVRVFPPETKAAAVYFGFERPLSGEARFYVQAMLHEGRTPFEGAFSLAELGWEWYDGARWRPAGLLEDGTHALLQSGFVRLELGGETGPLERPDLTPGHYLRCSLRAGGYDLPPRLGRVTFDCVRAVQADTCARVLEYTYEGAPLEIDYAVRPGDLVTVAVERGGGFEVWYGPDPSGRCALEAGPEPWRRTVRFDREEFGDAPAPSSRVAVFVTAGEAYERLFLGETDGCAEQRFDFAAEGLRELRLALVEERAGGARLALWDLCEDLGRADWDDRVFAYDADAGQVVFGDGVHGMQPERGLRVWAVTVSVSVYGDGNVRRGRVDRMLDGFAAGTAVQNLDDATGGRFPERSEELEALIGERLERASRAVTAEDYRKLALATPGLLVDLVNVIPMRDYCACYGGEPQPNTVLVAVKPRAEEERPGLSEAYRAQLTRHLDRHRLLTTCVKVIPARYVGVRVNGRVRLTENTPANRRLVQDRLRELIDFSHTRAFGQEISYGRVFSMLELLPCVQSVGQLFFELADPWGRENERGDLQLYPDALAYLQRVGIEFS